MAFQDRIHQRLRESANLHDQLLSDSQFQEQLTHVIEAFTQTLRNGGKVLFCGNGGSAADAQHLAAELSGRFYHDRAPFFAEALHVNTSYLTAVANDVDFSMVYQRAVEAKGRKGDLLVGLSTSGRSTNVLQAMIKARELNMTVVAMTGDKASEMDNYSDWLIRIPSTDTPRIQEAHILAGHIICECVEEFFL